jgi:hypothetical protein
LKLTPKNVNDIRPNKNCKWKKRYDKTNLYVKKIVIVIILKKNNFKSKLKKIWIIIKKKDCKLDKNLKRKKKEYKSVNIKQNSFVTNKGNNKITELRAILQRESQNS